MELMIAATILAVALVALLGVFAGNFGLIEWGGDLTVAINHAQCVMEEMRQRNIPANVLAEDWTTWAKTSLASGGGGLNSLTGEAINVSYPSGTGAVPLKIVVTVCWQKKGGQVVGEDDNLDGAFAAAEDDNENNRLDSPAQLITLFMER
jgi:hypothetical protein